ncbi:MAG: electron transport complex subunit RsxC [Candidatus Omnitrophota bacterium]|nr:electron transport complex subunit RsxC [Candidatus Omnitrophota bacterium]
MFSGFYGGVHPPAFKTSTSDRPIKRVFMPQKVVLPLSQNVGSPAEPIVSAGDAVSVGSKIARPSGFISSFLHATISGKVTKIAYSPTPAQDRMLSIIIEAQGSEDQELKLMPARDISSFSRDELLNMVKEAGVVGLGGAAFPTHVKLSPPKTKPIDTVILNGAECEPYLTCDHRLMLEKSKEILRGLEIINKILGVKKAFIAIEDNKLSALYSMERALSAAKERGQAEGVEVMSVRTKYPQGAEKQIIKSVLNRTVPSGGLPMDVGCIVQNMATTFAIYEAVYLKKPLIERVVTITGDCVKEPVNLWVRIGTTLADLVNLLGVFVKEPKKIIAGGPMMGIAQHTMDIPITKGTGGIVFLSGDRIDESKESVCIRCARCLEACPMGLVPTVLMHRVKKGLFSEAKDLGIAQCFECGACAYACPAKIPLLDYMKFGKSKVQGAK